MIEHWGGERLLHLKSVAHEYLGCIFMPESFFCHSLFFFINPRSAGKPAELVTSRIPKAYLRSALSALCYAFAFLLLALSTVPLPEAEAAKVTLGWDSNSEPDLEGYVIYRKTGSPGPPYDHVDTLPEDDLDDPLHPKVTLTGLKKDQQYYIALTAYNTEGVESDFSDDICVEVVHNKSAAECPDSPDSEDNDNNNDNDSNNDNNSNNNTSSSNDGDGGSGRSNGNSCFISTAGHASSTFSEFVAKPVIRSRGLLLATMLLVLIAAVKFEIKRTRGR
jgi:hypothetical protein